MNCFKEDLRDAFFYIREKTVRFAIMERSCIGRWILHKRLIWGIKIIIFIVLLLGFPMQSYAYFGKNGDYILS